MSFDLKRIVIRIMWWLTISFILQAAFISNGKLTMLDGGTRTKACCLPDYAEMMDRVLPGSTFVLTRLFLWLIFLLKIWNASRIVNPTPKITKSPLTPCPKNCGLTASPHTTIGYTQNWLTTLSYALLKPTTTFCPLRSSIL